MARVNIIVFTITTLCVTNFHAEAAKEIHDIHKGHVHNRHKYKHASSKDVEMSRDDNLSHNELFSINILLDPNADNKLNIRNRGEPSRRFTFLFRIFKYIKPKFPKPIRPPKPPQTPKPKPPKPSTHKTTRPSHSKPTSTNKAPSSSRKTTRRFDYEKPEIGEYDNYQETTTPAAENTDQYE